MIGVISRAKVLGAIRGRSIAANVQLLAQESRAAIAWLLPYGRSALPTGGDAIVASVGGIRDDQVILGVDDPALRIHDLKPGEFGDSDGVSSTVYRLDGLEMQSAEKITIQADGRITIIAPVGITLRAATVKIEGDLEVTGSIRDGAGTLGALRDAYDAHRHPETGSTTGTTDHPA